MWSWLKQSLQAIINTVTRVVQRVIDGIYSIANWFWSIVVYCGQVVWDFFFHSEDGLVWQVCDWFAEWGEWFLEQLPDIGSILEPYQDSASVVMNLIGKLNGFFPIEEMILLMGAFLLFCSIFLGVKFILKIIPWCVG